jgi:hypothetical protein
VAETAQRNAVRLCRSIPIAPNNCFATSIWRVRWTPANGSPAPKFAAVGFAGQEAVRCCLCESVGRFAGIHVEMHHGCVFIEVGERPAQPSSSKVRGTGLSKIATDQTAAEHHIIIIHIGSVFQFF